MFRLFFYLPSSFRFLPSIETRFNGTEVGMHNAWIGSSKKNASRRNESQTFPVDATHAQSFDLHPGLMQLLSVHMNSFNFRCFILLHLRNMSFDLHPGLMQMRLVHAKSYNFHGFLFFFLGHSASQRKV